MSVHRLLAITALLLAVAINPWSASFFAMDGFVAPTHKLKIFLAQSALLMCSCYFFTSLFRRSLMITSVRRISLSFAILLGLFLSLELSFYSLNSSQARSQIQRSSQDSLVVTDPELGYRLRAGSKVNSLIERQGVVSLGSVYNINAQGQRRSSYSQESKRPAMAYFFGGSTVFGEGVEDDQHLASRFGHYAPKYQAVNYGVPGYGPQQCLKLVQSQRLLGQSAAKEGVGIYILEDSHIARAAGSLKVSGGYGGSFPCYDLDSDGQIQSLGRFESARPIRTSLFSFAAKLEFVKYFDIEHPQSNSDHNNLLTAKLLAQAAKSFAQAFDQSKFYVVFAPASTVGESMKKSLAQAGIEYLDYSKLISPNELNYWLAGEERLSAAAYDLIAKEIAADLTKANHGGS